MDAGDLFESIDIHQIIPLIALGAVQGAREAREWSNTSIRIKDGALSGADYLRELLNCGNTKRIYGVLRMKKETFTQLCQWFRKNGHLTDSREIKIEQQVAQFLWIINYSASIDATAERFRVSTEPVSR
jgi:hypothetical protein